MAADGDGAHSPRCTLTKRAHKRNEIAHWQCISCGKERSNHIIRLERGSWQGRIGLNWAAGHVLNFIPFSDGKDKIYSSCERGLTWAGDCSTFVQSCEATGDCEGMETTNSLFNDFNGKCQISLL